VSKGWAGGSTRQWRRVRALVLVRDGFACQLKLDVCTSQATCVHHTAGRSVTGDDPTYLVASCAPCNLKLGDPTKGASPQARKITRW
jgi:5-methylcytosine-specific restriction endonuclease McrA